MRRSGPVKSQFSEKPRTMTKGPVQSVGPDWFGPRSGSVRSDFFNVLTTAWIETAGVLRTTSPTSEKPSVFYLHIICVKPNITLKKGLRGL